jgi:hypothetical protein
VHTGLDLPAIEPTILPTRKREEPIFQKELRNKIFAFSKIERRNDNPVYDILGERIKPIIDPEKYVSRESFENQKKEVQSLSYLVELANHELERLHNKEADSHDTENELRRSLLSLFVSRLRLLLIARILK